MRESLVLTYPADRPVSAGQRLLLAPDELPGLREPVITAIGGLPALRAGTKLLKDPDKPLLAVAGAFYWPRKPGETGVKVYLCEALQNGRLVGGADTFRAVRDGYSLAWVTLSDKGSAGLRIDESGPLIAQIADDYLPLCRVQGFILPDKERPLRAMLTDLALTQGYDLIVTTGGTGIAPTDHSPEATLAVIDKRLPGFESAMMAASLAKTPMAAISRAVCGTLGDSIIVNLPGSPKAVRENFMAVLPAIDHALKKLQGDPADCAKV